jgi:hypothetical protein
MKAELVTVEHFGSLDELEQIRELLEDAGLHPEVFDETRHRFDGVPADSDGVFALQVPETELETAEALLEDAMQTEESAGALMSDWGYGRDD